MGVTSLAKSLLPYSNMLCHGGHAAAATMVPLGIEKGLSA
jgi:hypothetical protein